MVKIKLSCKVCGKLLNNEKDLMTHYFMEHKGIEHYAVPVFVGELPIPVKPAAKNVKKTKRYVEPQPIVDDDDIEEDEEDEEDLRID